MIVDVLDGLVVQLEIRVCVPWGVRKSDMPMETLAWKTSWPPRAAPSAMKSIVTLGLYH